VLAIVTASVFGLTDELHQLFVPFRESSWQDWLADTIGAVIGAMSWRFLWSK
jgi:VanZ family protein